jgi:uncharacterized lipoprotein YddW (UPF0748 family)
MNNIFKKMILVVLTAALVFAAFPVTSVFAKGENPPKGELTNEKLEKIWARELKTYEQLGKVFSDIDGQAAKIQKRIDEAAKNGKDVSAVQVALDAFKAAAKAAKPTYDSISGIVNTHQGFDASGKVTDAEQAKSTLKEIHTKMLELKTAMGGTGKALRDALKAFREANKPTDGSQRSK